MNIPDMTPILSVLLLLGGGASMVIFVDQKVSKVKDELAVKVDGLQASFAALKDSLGPMNFDLQHQKLFCQRCQHDQQARVDEIEAAIMDLRNYTHKRVHELANKMQITLAAEYGPSQ